MNILKQWILVLMVYFLGEIVSKGLSLPIPGNIMGMIFLFLFLVTGIIKLEKIENEYDLESYNKAIEEYRKNPKTYTLEEVKEELGL